MARRIPRKAGKGFGNFGNLSADIRKAAVDALRNAAKEVLNDLAEASPNWSGDFRESWYVETADGRRGAKPTGEGGRYNLFNIPSLTTQGRDAKGRFASTLPTGKTELFIGNSAPYAQEAMDLIPGSFEYPGFGPKGKVVARGVRQNDIRGDIKPGKGDNRSTAPLDWYSTYMNGGAFRAAFNKGAQAGFLEARNRPRATPQ